MDDRAELTRYLMDVIGEEGCGVSCSEAEVYRDSDGWKMKLEGFMEPWELGENVEAAKASIKEYASMRFGLS